jgi:hypothetical protein
MNKQDLKTQIQAIRNAFPGYDVVGNGERKNLKNETERLAEMVCDLLEALVGSLESRPGLTQQQIVCLRRGLRMLLAESANSGATSDECKERERVEIFDAAEALDALVERLLGLTPKLDADTIEKGLKAK